MSSSTGFKPVTLVIDPGHGGHDPGAVYEGVREADLNLAIALRLKTISITGLKPATPEPVTLVLTREDDRFVALPARAETANELGAALFVSIHCDAATRPEVSGFSVHHAPGSERGSYLAQALHRALVRALPGRHDQGVLSSSFLVLRRTAMPAALVECEFLSHPGSRAWLQTPEAQAQLAQAIRQGIEDFLQMPLG
jgi:N-acetylmuramoyl-L-alanine amidase